MSLGPRGRLFLQEMAKAKLQEKVPRELAALLTAAGREREQQAEALIRARWHTMLGVSSGTSPVLADLVRAHVTAEATESIPARAQCWRISEELGLILLGRIANQALPAVRRYRSRVALLALALALPEVRAMLVRDVAPLPPELPDLDDLRGRIMTGAGFADPVSTLSEAWNRVTSLEQRAAQSGSPERGMIRPPSRWTLDLDPDEKHVCVLADEATIGTVLRDRRGTQGSRLTFLSGAVHLLVRAARGESADEVVMERPANVVGARHAIEDACRGVVKMPGERGEYRFDPAVVRCSDALAKAVRKADAERRRRPRTKRRK